MRTIGVIGSQVIESNAFAAELCENENIVIKLYTEKSTVYIDKTKLPFTEMVENAEEIISDSRIDTVFVSREELKFIGPALRAGKSVRVA